ncbi:transcriptional regulator, LacI family [Thermobaculum terrenum ATCC BAA-798]|uniref:Transcriptional regulator, LacI family n=2 Tax=Thermobaculum TaxID=262406 RepID=D1CHI2_THET1|nr:transcriptional regulator, LacI family [Thermobaculum terrenum ATCC BAA-798]
MGNVKISDVAKKAGVSTATVSRVLSGKTTVDPILRDRVLKAVEETGYKPDRVARSLRKRQSSIIGLIISDIQNPFFISLVRAVEDVAQKHGYIVMLGNADEDERKEREYIQVMISERVAGVIVSPSREYNDPCEDLVRAKIPLVLVDRRVPGLDVDTIVVNNTWAAQQLVMHLIEHGHSRIGAVLGTSIVATGRERREGYVQALLQYGFPIIPNLIKVGPPPPSGANREDTGYRLTMELLNAKERPTALFTGTNLLTIGALRAIQEKGLSIPEDIALVGFDDIDWMPVYNPSITVAAQPTYHIGRIAAEMLIARIQGDESPAQEIVLQPEIKIRRSCGQHVSINCDK